LTWKNERQVTTGGQEKKTNWMILQSHFESVSAAYDAHVTRLDFRGSRAMKRELDRLMADAHLEARREGTQKREKKIMGLFRKIIQLKKKDEYYYSV
jgi:hypothetical protein